LLQATIQFQVLYKQDVIKKDSIYKILDVKIILGKSPFFSNLLDEFASILPWHKPKNPCCLQKYFSVPFLKCFSKDFIMSVYSTSSYLDTQTTDSSHEENPIAIKEWYEQVISTQISQSLLEESNTEKMIQLLTSDQLEQLLKEASKNYDHEGHNLALKLAKKIHDPIARKSAIACAGKHLSANQEALFKQMFNQRLSMLNTLFQEIRQQKSNPQLERGNQAEQTIARSHSKEIEGSFPNQSSITLACVGKSNSITEIISEHLSQKKQLQFITGEIDSDSLDVLIAPHSLYQHMEEIFQESVSLLKNTILLEQTFLFKCFGFLKKNGIFLCTLRSGPNIANYLDLLEGIEAMNFQMFNYVETFFRCLDIFNRFFVEKTGKKICADISFLNQHQPIDQFLKNYSHQNWEERKREQFFRLISIFLVNNEIVDLDITLKLSLQESTGPRLSFKPLNQHHLPMQEGSNELSLGQLNPDQQLQKLNGSELAMIDIKDADGLVQFGALQSILGKKMVRIVDIGGGRGETNAVMKALHDSGSIIRLLNIDHDEKVADTYRLAHESVGIHAVRELPMKVQHLSSSDILNSFDGEKVQAIFASHSLYFENRDLFLASLHHDLPLQQHPLWKYFEVMDEEGVLVVTLQSGTGGRMIRDVLLGDHGLNPPKSDHEIELLKLFSIFGNAATFLRYFEQFSQRFQQATGKSIEITMRYSVANVSLGDFKVEKDEGTQQPEIFNPHGDNEDPDWHSLKMFDFYGNWKELRESIKQTQNREKREAALQSQKVYLAILPFFAPGLVSMQHPNITLEIRIKK
jgi:hypothetical protein